MRIWAQDGGMRGRPSKILGDREMLHQNQHVQAQRKQMLIGVVFVDKYDEICPIHTQNHGMHITCSGFS